MFCLFLIVKEAFECQRTDKFQDNTDWHEVWSYIWEKQAVEMMAVPWEQKRQEQPVYCLPANKYYENVF